MSEQSTNVNIASGLDGYYAAPKGQATGGGVVVVMEAFGLTRHIRGVCDRLAAVGIAAVAPDVYHGKQFAYTDMDGAIGELKKMNDEQVMREVGASLDFLAGKGATQLGATGFCMGGRFAFLANCVHASRLKAAVAFYGGGIAPKDDQDMLGRPPPIRQAAKMKAPILMIYGGQDPMIDNNEQGRIADALGALGKHYTITLYPEATHGFCCEDRASYHPASAKLAYAEMLEYFQRAFAA